MVSCIMPTRNRPGFVRAAIDCFLRQTYQEKELIILDDSDAPGSVEIDSAWPIKYVLDERKPLGAKRNDCCELAIGEIICHLDDDDYSTPDRIEFQVALLEQSKKPVTGFGVMYFWDTIHKAARLYRSGNPGYVCGTSLCYRRDFWETHKFKEIAEKEDNAFVDPILKQIAASNDPSHMVARIHESNTSSKTGIIGTISNEILMSGFWENEEMRLSSAN
jgi:glycosyltransferase involved in cell wall biosynthesis